MSLLSELTTTMSGIGIPVETGVFSGEAPDTYCVLTPLVDLFDLHADDTPGVDIQEVRVSLFSKDNYIDIKDRIVRAILAANMTITNRAYIGHEDDTGYHHYSIDAEQTYEWEG
jgi:hypothetical protein